MALGSFVGDIITLKNLDSLTNQDIDVAVQAAVSVVRSAPQDRITTAEC